MPEDDAAVPKSPGESCFGGQDGYLIVKEGKVEPFLGCTNFKADKTGCDGFMTREYYEKNVLNK